MGVFSNILAGLEGPGEGNRSLGRSLVTLMGLSSIVGPIFVEMIEFRCIRLALLSPTERNDEEPVTVLLPTEDDAANELRPKCDARGPLLRTNVSISARSASSRLGGAASGVNTSRWGVAYGSPYSGRKGISMLERTSWSNNPSICISCSFALATNLSEHSATCNQVSDKIKTNLSSRIGKSICLSQKLTAIQKGSHQNVRLTFPFQSFGS